MFHAMLPQLINFSSALETASENTQFGRLDDRYPSIPKRQGTQPRAKRRGRIHGGLRGEWALGLRFFQQNSQLLYFCGEI